MHDGRLLRQSLTPTIDEFALGSLLDPVAGAPRLPRRSSSIRDELERALLPPLFAGPVFVLFSGGLDSSLLLAITTHLARSHGLDVPVPVTHRYPLDPHSREHRWQELMVSHLALPDWLKVDATARHDLLGPSGLNVLRRHGPQLPAHWWITRLPPEARVRAGSRASVVAGHGGDELCSPTPWPLVDRLLRGDVRALRPARSLARELRPAALRERDVRRWIEADLSWVRAPERGRLAGLQTADVMRLSRRYSRFASDLWQHRSTQSVLDRTSVSAAESGADLVAPFLDPMVMAAFASRYPMRFPASRAEVYGEVAGELLPRELLQRRTKAVVASGFFGDATRAWLETWDGSGPDERIVDGAAVRAAMLAACDGPDDGDARLAGLVARARHAELRPADGVSDDAAAK